MPTYAAMVVGTSPGPETPEDVRSGEGSFGMGSGRGKGRGDGSTSKSSLGGSGGSRAAEYFKMSSGESQQWSSPDSRSEGHLSHENWSWGSQKWNANWEWVKPRDGWHEWHNDDDGRKSGYHSHFVGSPGLHDAFGRRSGEYDPWRERDPWGGREGNGRVLREVQGAPQGIEEDGMASPVSPPATRM